MKFLLPLAFMVSALAAGWHGYQPFICQDLYPYACQCIWYRYCNMFQVIRFQWCPQTCRRVQCLIPVIPLPPPSSTPQPLTPTPTTQRPTSPRTRPPTKPAWICGPGNEMKEPTVIETVRKNLFSFGWDLYRDIENNCLESLCHNSLLAPTSAFFLLGMALAGTVPGEATSETLRKRLLPDVNASAVLRSFLWLKENLPSAGKLAIQNRATHHNFLLREGYEKILKDCFHAKVSSASGSQNAEGTKEPFVGQSITEASIGNSTVNLNISSEITFNMDWDKTFPEKNKFQFYFRTSSTQPNGDGELVSGSFIETTARFVENKLLQLLMIDYEGLEISHVFLLPQTGQNLGEIQSRIYASDLRTLIEKAAVRNVNFTTLENQEISSNTSEFLKNLLRFNWIRNMFTEGEFTEIQSDTNLSFKFNGVQQSNFLKSGFSGTQANSTKTFNGRKLKRKRRQGGSELLQLALNRSFIFFIYHRPTSAILFIGDIRIILTDMTQGERKENFLVWNFPKYAIKNVTTASKDWPGISHSALL